MMTGAMMMMLVVRDDDDHTPVADDNNDANGGHVYNYGNKFDVCTENHLLYLEYCSNIYPYR